MISNAITSHVPAGYRIETTQSHNSSQSINVSLMRENIRSINNSRSLFLASMLHSQPDTILGNDNAKNSGRPAIDSFIDKLDSMKIESKSKIGAGSYGTCYRFDDFVVKVPVNCHDKFVDWGSQEHKNATPERVSKYLNIANDDPDYSRCARTVFKDKAVNVLVSKFVEGRELDVNDPDNYDRASDLLEDRGLYMHDINVIGNILVDKNNDLHVIDGDQLVPSQTKRLERQPSVSTVDLEDQIETSLRVKLKMAMSARNQDDTEYYQSLLDDLKALRGDIANK